MDEDIAVHARRLSGSGLRHRSGTGLALLTIVVAAAALRLWAIDHGQPYVYHPDEWVTAKAAMRMVENASILPPWYYYPSLLTELLTPVISVMHGVTGATLISEPPWGAAGMRQMGWSEAYPEQFEYFLAGRWIVTLFGIATVPLVFAIGRRLAGPVAGMAAGAIVAGSVLHVVHSTFLTTDVPLAFMGAAVLWASVRFLDDRRLRWLVLAAVATGLAASTKYNGASLLLLPALAWYLGRPASGPDPVPLLRAVPIGGLAALLTAIAGTPALILDPGAVIAGLQFQGDAYIGTGFVGASSEGPRIIANLVYYASYLWGSGLGPAVMILIAVGVIRAIRRRTGADILLLVFPVVYLLIASLPLIRFERNLLVVVPFLAVLGGLGMIAIADAFGRLLARVRPGRPWRAAALVGLFVGTVAVTAPLTAMTLASFDAIDTRSIALDWITSNLPRGSRIVRERYTPQVDQQTLRTDFTDDLIARPVDWYRTNGYAYIISSDYSYGRYFDGDHQTQEAGYEAIFSLPEVYHVAPEGGSVGPTIRIFRLDP